MPDPAADSTGMLRTPISLPPKCPDSSCECQLLDLARILKSSEVQAWERDARRDEQQQHLEARILQLEQQLLQHQDHISSTLPAAPDGGALAAVHACLDLTTAVQEVATRLDALQTSLSEAYQHSSEMHSSSAQLLAQLDRRLSHLEGRTSNDAALLPHRHHFQQPDDAYSAYPRQVVLQPARQADFSHSQAGVSTSYGHSQPGSAAAGAHEPSTIHADLALGNSQDGQGELLAAVQVGEGTQTLISHRSVYTCLEQVLQPDRCVQVGTGAHAYIRPHSCAVGLWRAHMCTHMWRGAQPHRWV